MATITSTTANVTGLTELVASPFYGLQIAPFRHVLLGTEAADDIIRLGTLPKGAIVFPQLSYVTRRSDPGTALTIDLGITGSVDRYADGLVCDAAGTSAFTTPAVPTQVSAPAALSESSELIATVKVATSLTAAVVIEVAVVYAINP